MYTLNISFKTYKHPQTKLNFLIKNILKKHIFLKNIKIKNIIQLKTKNKIYTVLKSPHVHKKSREHFNFKTFKQNIQLKDQCLMKILYFFFILKKVTSSNYKIKSKLSIN